MGQVFLLFFWLFFSTAYGATLTVGPVGSGKQYEGSGSAICSAIAAATATTADNGDIIELDGVAPGGAQAAYVDQDCGTYSKSILIRGVGAQRPKITRSTGATLSGGHGFFRPYAGYQAFENIEFTNARCGSNCSPIWVENTDVSTGVKRVRLTNVLSYDNDMGILVGNHGGNSTFVPQVDRTLDVVIENSEFHSNGVWDGNSHNVYIGRVRSLTFRNNYSYDSYGGQLLKCRTSVAYVINNKFVDSMQSGYPTTGGLSNFESSFPFGGKIYYIGNTIYQSGNVPPPGRPQPNQKMLEFCSECPGPDGYLKNELQQYAVVNNTLVNARVASGAGVFISINFPSGSTTTMIEDNIFAGPGDPFWREEFSDTTPANNTVSATVAGMNFRNAAQLDFHLTASSPGLNLAVDHGTFPSGCTVDCYSLIPTTQYAAPRTQITRTVVSSGRDRGAFEYTLGGTAYLGRVRLEAQNGSGQVALFFSPAERESNTQTGVEIRRNGSVIATTGADATSYVDTTGTAGTAYTYTAKPKGSPDGTESLGIVAGSARAASGNWGTEAGWHYLTASFTDACVGASCSNYWGIYTMSAYDPITNQLFLWGGNAAAHNTNEVYAFRVAEKDFIAINTADTAQAGDYAVGGVRPNARRTYWGGWIPTTNQLFTVGGQIANDSWSSRVWRFAPGTNTWSDHALGFTPGGGLYLAPSTWSSNASRMLFTIGGNLYEYNPATNTSTSIRAVTAGYRSPLVHASHSNKTFQVGDGVAYSMDGANGYAITNLPLSCAALKVGLYPALGYDSDRQKIVHWDGYSTVTLIEPTTGECTPQTFVGEPAIGTGIPNNGLQYASTLRGFLLARNNGTIALLRTLALETNGPGRVGGGVLSGGGVRQ